MAYLNGSGLEKLIGCIQSGVVKSRDYASFTPTGSPTYFAKFKFTDANTSWLIQYRITSKRTGADASIQTAIVTISGMGGAIASYEALNSVKNTASLSATAHVISFNGSDTIYVGLAMPLNANEIKMEVMKAFGVSAAISSPFVPYISPTVLASIAFTESGTINDIQTSGGVPEAPMDGTQYGRQNGAWTPVTGGGGGGFSDVKTEVFTKSFSGSFSQDYTVNGKILKVMVGSNSYPWYGFANAGNWYEGNSGTTITNVGGLSAGAKVVISADHTKATVSSTTSASGTFYIAIVYLKN